MINRIVGTAYHFMLEFFMGILLLFLFYISKKDLPPIFLVTFLGFAGIILFTFLLSKFSNKGKWLFFVTIFPLLLVASTVASLSLLLGAVIGLFVFFRGISLFDDFLDHSAALTLLWSFLIGLVVIIYSAMSHYPFQSFIIFLLFFQLLLVIGGGFFRKWTSIHTDKSKFALYFIKIILGLSMIGAVITFSYKYIQFVFFGLLQLIAMIFSSISAPFFNFILYLLSFSGKKEFKSNLNSSDIQDQAGKYQEHSYAEAQHILYIILILGVAAMIIYVIYKKKLKLQTITGDASPLIKTTETIFDPGLFSRPRGRVKPPDDVVRREIFDLEKCAHKYKLGRLPFETLGEWWQRIGINGSEESVAIYESVRYGGAAPSTEEQAFIKAEIRLLKKQVKDIHKARER